MSTLASRLVCGGCATALAPDERLPFRCPRADTGDGADHVLQAQLDLAGTTFEHTAASHPFVRYRELLHVYRCARRSGLGDADWAELVATLDSALASVCGRGLSATPLARNEALSAELGLRAPGGLWVKDETRCPTGTHKGRHLFGVALHLMALERSGRSTGGERLAIASCGNAAVAAAAVARALGRPLEVFVPTWADPEVLDLLERYGARTTVCERTPTSPPGDPCVQRFRAAVAAGSLPFTCQGTENGLVIEGGQTLAFEVASAWNEPRPLDRVAVQVGGGALATAVMRAFATAVALGALPSVPELLAVQSEGGHPLVRAWEHLCTEAAAGAAVDGLLVRAARERARYMQPWESEPQSLATGILDDETYDWLAVVRALAATGGEAITTPETTIARARELGRAATGIAVTHTGAAGLAGLLTLAERGALRSDECVLVIFSGGER